MSHITHCFPCYVKQICDANCASDVYLLENLSTTAPHNLVILEKSLPSSFMAAISFELDNLNFLIHLINGTLHLKSYINISCLKYMQRVNVSHVGYVMHSRQSICSIRISSRHELFALQNLIAQYLLLWFIK